MCSSAWSPAAPKHTNCKACCRGIGASRAGPTRPWRHDDDRPPRASRTFDGAARRWLADLGTPDPEVQMTLRQQRGVSMPANCSVTWISYAGDEGGIVCRLEAAAETAEAVFASITHLRFDPRLSLTREIVAYQKHRVKRLRLQPR